MNKSILFSVCFSFFATGLFAQKNKKDSKINPIHVKSAVLAAGKLFRVKDFPTKNIQPRNIDIWLPENYSENKKYAVLYMHDGQNLFDATTTWNKQEWMVDEIATQLMEENKVKDFIVVGIHSISTIRWQDLYPEKAMDFLKNEDKDALYKEAAANNLGTDLNGDAYLKFIIDELKPFIDKNYSVAKDRKNTFVAGSSMGGLMSMYAVAEYPKVFGGAACISTHWVGATPRPDNKLPASIFSYLEANLPKATSHKMYFDYGNKTLDQFYPVFAPKVDAIFKNGGYTKENYKNLFFEGTDHSEKSWQKRVHIPFTFLLKK